MEKRSDTFFSSKLGTKNGKGGDLFLYGGVPQAWQLISFIRAGWASVIYKGRCGMCLMINLKGWKGYEAEYLNKSSIPITTFHSRKICYLMMSLCCDILQQLHLNLHGN